MRLPDNGPDARLILPVSQLEKGSLFGYRFKKGGYT